MPDRTKITVDAPLYEKAKELDAQLAAREGRLTNVSNYVRRAVAEYNRKIAAELAGTAQLDGRVPFGRSPEALALAVGGSQCPGDPNHPPHPIGAAPGCTLC